MTRKRIIIPILGLAVFLMPALPAFTTGPGVMERIKQARDPVDEKTVPTVPLPADAVRVKEEYRGGSFYTESRKDKIQRYPCSTCHNNVEVRIKNAAKITHADRVIVHGGESGPLDCYTCHSRTDRDLLNTSKDKAIDMDHVYTLCGECHFRQKKDWIGGAHGKPVSHWAGDRVVKNCTSCHDPHSPRFPTRWPATYSPPFN